MATPALTINGTDAQAAFGFTLADAPGWSDAPPLRAGTPVVLPGRSGARLATRVGVALDDGPRPLTLRGAVTGATVAARQANLDALKSALRGGTTDGMVALTFADSPTRETVVTVDRVTVTSPTNGGAAFLAPALAVDLACTALSAYARDIAQTTTSIPSGGGVLALGTAPCLPTITISGASTNPSVTLLTWGGATVATLAFTGLTTVGGDTLVLDSALLTAKKNGASVLALSTGDFAVLDIERQGDYALARWPQLTYAGISGTVSVAYRKAWR